MSNYVPSHNSQARFDRRNVKPTMHPRRVVGGLRLQARPTSTADDATKPVDANGENSAPAAATPGWTWASAHWMRVAETSAPGDQLAEGLEYAYSGQIRALEIKPGGGAISAKVQGRMPAAYKSALRLPTFSHEQWELVIASMTQHAKYAAAILSGELPANIEDLFAPQGLRLFPTDPSDLSPSCNCSVFTGIEPMTAPLPPMNWSDTPAPVAPIPPPPPKKASPGIPWCKHVCCMMYLLAERLGQQPLLILSLRGMAETDLVERLRQARALAGMSRAGSGTPGASPGGGLHAASPVYSPHVPLPDRADHPLPALAHDFWHAPDPDALAELDCPIAAPEVSHPLLRRLGSSPFAGAKFPLVGLLATCYDLISAAAIDTVKNADAPEPDALTPDDESSPIAR